MLNRLTVITVALASVLTSSAAVAESAMIVRLRGLDLQTRSGAAIALQRMDDSAREFCRGDDPSRLDVTTGYCRRDMTARAVRKLGAHGVTRLYMTAAPGGFQTAAR